MTPQTTTTAVSRPSTPTSPRVSAAQISALVIGPALVMLDSGIANVAIQPLATEFNHPVTTAQWIVSAYLLAIAVGLTVTTQLTRRFGARRYYIFSLVAFMATSLACGLSTSLEMLIGMRVLQGFAGAALVPLAMTGLMPSSDDAKGSGQINPAVGAVMFMAPVLGPPAAGLILTVADWPWLFVVNVPIGLLGLACAMSLRDDIFPVSARGGTVVGRRLDVLGFLLLTPSVVALVMTGVRIGNPAVSTANLLATGALGACLLVLYVVHARRSAHPLIDVSPVAALPSMAALAASVLTSVVAFAMVVLIPVFTQGVQGHSAEATGLALLPQGLAVGVGTGVAYGLSRVLRVRVMIAFGLGLLLACLVGMYLVIDPSTPLWVTSLLLTGRGLAVGLVIQPLLSSWLGSVPSAVKTDCNSIFTIMERLGGSIGIGVIVSTYYTDLVHSGPADALRNAVGVLCVITLVVIALTPLLPQGNDAPESPRAVLDPLESVEQARRLSGVGGQHRPARGERGACAGSHPVGR